MASPALFDLKKRSLLTEIAFICKLMFEYLRASLIFRKYQHCITVFGSARTPTDHPWYAQCEQMGALLGKHGFYVMTGAGPGQMEAANRGAFETGHSLGCGIRIPSEQINNPYLNHSFTCQYFFVRKVLLAKFSQAFVVAPGGFGTLDELFEVITLIQTEKMPDIPVVLLNKSYWQPLMDFVENTLIKHGTVSKGDAKNIYLVDTPEEALNTIKQHAQL